MSYKEVTELRKSGRLEDAFRMAKNDLDNIRDEWSLRAMIWVMEAYVHKFAVDMNIDRFVKSIDYICQLQVPLSETVFFESLCWRVRELVSNLNSQDYTSLDRIFAAVSNLSFPPSDAKSAMFGAFHKFKDNWFNYSAFCDWWNFDSFMPKDYESFKPEGNTKIKVMSLVEKACVGYSKSILKYNDRTRIENFIPWLKSISEAHPEYQYPTYYMCKLYIALGDKKTAFDAVIPFVKKKSNDFWVWQTLGDSSDDEEICFRCYSRALSCDTPNDFLVGIKEKYAVMLAARQMYSEAKAEIEDVFDIRRKNGWRIPSTLQDLTSRSWLQTVERSADNRQLYRKYGENAELIIYPDTSVISVFVVYINTDKQICNYVDKEGRTGFFGYRKLKKFFPKVGNVYNLNIRSRNDDGWTEVTSFKQVKDDVWKDNKMVVEGTLSKKEDKKSGNMECNGFKVFVPPALASDLKNNDKVKGVALKMIDKKKGCLGWTMVLLLV